MKTKFITIILILSNLIFFTHILNASATKIKTNNSEDKITETKEKYKIQIYYPITEYKKLNNQINTDITNYLKEFKTNVKNSTIPVNQYYHLIILYEKYEYSNYLSFIFRIEDFTGGAHPNHRIKTIVYNKETNELENIDNLIKKNKNFLNTISTISRDELKTNSHITNLSMLYEGTKPTKENFSNFVYSKYGLIFFFTQYQVAPYSQGEFNVIIPYSKLNNQ